MQELTHLSLCSGIGGLDLAAEWAGFKTVAQCEIDEYASKVLAKNFRGGGGIPNLNDIRTVTAGRLRKLGINPAAITVVSAGFPCQPYSLAGKGKGDSDERDLWGEVARVIGELRPKWFVGENTPGLFSRENQRYFRRVLNDLTALGYSVGWGIWGACDVGAPHKRHRVFILAHSDGERRNIYEQNGRAACKPLADSEAKAPVGASSVYGNVSDADVVGRSPDDFIKQCTIQTLDKSRRQNELSRTDSLYADVPDADSERQRQPQGFEQESWGRLGNVCEEIANAASNELGLFGSEETTSGITSCGRDNRKRVLPNDGREWWETEPDVGRVANGISSRVDRLRCLGNAVAPYQALPIFEAIAELERE